MPLESGIGIPSPDGRRDLHEQFIQDALAYCENIPLNVLRPDFLSIERVFQTLASADAQAIQDALARQHRRRSEVFVALAKSTNVRDVMEEIEKLLFTSSYSYLSPLFRLLRDHHYYAWYENLCLLEAFKNAESNKLGLVEIDLFSEHRVCSVVSKIADGSFLVSGPVILEAEHSTEGKYYKDVWSSLTQFNYDISRAWNFRIKKDRHLGGYDLKNRGPVYTVEYLAKQAFQRQKTNFSDLQFAHNKILQIFKGLRSSRSLQSIQENLPIHMYGRLAATASALFDLSNAANGRSKSAEVDVKQIVEGRSSLVKVALDNTGAALVSTSTRLPNKDSFLTYSVERSLDRVYTNWQSYQYESFVLFRNWLNNKFGYVSRFSKMPNLQREYADFSSRICRFLVRLYRADECTIYKINYQSSIGELVRQGAYLNRVDADLRLRLMGDHMTQIAAAPETRQESICYRAIDRIRTEYCRHEQKTNVTDGDYSSRLSYPQSDEVKLWGVSAVATPIIVQGVPWGVLELISDRPHHFSGAARAKIEDVASILSPFFYFQSVFDALERAGSAANNADLPLEERKQKLLSQLFDVFLCKAVAIVTRETAPEEKSVAAASRSPAQHIHLFGHKGLWWFPDTVSSKIPLKELMPFAKIPFGETYYWACRIGGKEFSQVFQNAGQNFIAQHKGASLLIIRLTTPQENLARREAEEFLIALILRKEVLVDLKLVELFAFFGSFLVSTLDSFYSHETWERVLRNRLGHELNKIWRNIESSQKKFDDEIGDRIRFETDGAAGLYWRLVDDLKRHARSVQLYSEILSRRRDNLAFRDHPQVYITRQRMATERKALVSLKQIYDSAFMGRSKEFLARNIIVDVFEHEQDVKIESYDWLLLDVMQTLADNVLKYASSGRSLEVSIKKGAFNNIHFRVSNVAPALEPADWGRIFSEGFRGAYARAKKGVEGQGIGLFLAQRMMAVAGYDLDYGQRSPERPSTEAGFPLAWHDFTLVFPGRVRPLQQ